MPLSLVIASMRVNASIYNDSKQLKECETARAYKGEKIGQAKVRETLGTAASFAPTNTKQLLPCSHHNGHPVTYRRIRKIRTTKKQILNSDCIYVCLSVCVKCTHWSVCVGVVRGGAGGSICREV